MRHNQTRREVLNIDGVVSVSEGLDEGRRVIVVGIKDRSLVGDPRIPDTIDGLPVVFEEQSNPGLAAAVPPLVGDGRQGGLPTPVSASHATRRRPIPPGVSIGHVDVSAGTSSFLATDGSELFGLSNNHVLALGGQAEVGDTILQPGSADGGIVGVDDAGKLAGYVEIGSESTVDIGWYRPSVGVSNDIPNVGNPKSQTRDPELGETIQFVGRTSGVAEAVVDRVNADVELQNGNQFTDQFRLDRPLLPGDSGAPIVTQNGNPAGVGFASTEANGWCNYISNVEAETGLTVIETALGEGGFGLPISRPAMILGGIGLLVVTGD